MKVKLCPMYNIKQIKLLSNGILKEIKNEASMQAIEEELSTAEARNAVNRNKNRYRDVSPCMYQ